MVTSENYLTASRELAKWWLGSLGLIASTTLGLLGFSSLWNLNPAASVLIGLLLLIGVVISVLAMLSVATLYKKPRQWSELSVSERNRCDEFGLTLTELEEMSRQTTNKDRALQIQDRVVSLVAMDKTATDLVEAKGSLRKYAFAAFVLIGVALVIRGAEWSKPVVCLDELRACQSVPVSQATRVRVILAREETGTSSSAIKLRGYMRGDACDPSDGIEAVAVGGTYREPVIQFAGPRCYSGQFVLPREVGVIAPLTSPQS